MKDPKIFQQGALFKLELLEESYPAIRGLASAQSVSEQTLKAFHDHLEKRYGQHHLPGRTAYSYLVNGVVVEITRQGHQHYKRADLWSNTKEGLIALLAEANL